MHSNVEALEASVAAAPLHDAIVNLADIVGYGASRNEVTAKARELGGTLVRGNHDKVVAGLDNVETFNPTTFNPMAGIAALWNRAQLTSHRVKGLHIVQSGDL